MMFGEWRQVVGRRGFEGELRNDQVDGDWYWWGDGGCYTGLEVSM